MAFLPLLSVGATIAGTAVSAIGAASSASAQSSMYNYQSQVAANNAKIQSDNAQYASVAGETQSMESGLRTKAQIGETIARQGASGIAVTSPSSTGIVESERSIGQLDQSIIRNNAARKAYGFEVASTSELAQSGLYSQAASNAETAGSFKVAGSLLSGVSSVSDKWIAGKQSGLNFGAS